jgi:ferrous iron transport protein B
VAFIVDKLMHSIGLHGKSFIPMLIGFGCSVPAIMATRTLESKRDRLTTILIIPLMSCGARLPVYTLLTGAFFSPSMAGNVLFSIYLTGFILAVIMAKIFRKFLFPVNPLLLLWNFRLTGSLP